MTLVPRWAGRGSLPVAWSEACGGVGRSAGARLIGESLQALLEIQQAALDLVEGVQGALLIALGRQPECAPELRGHPVRRRLAFAQRAEQRAGRAEQQRALQPGLGIARRRALPGVEGLLPRSP